MTNLEKLEKEIRDKLPRLMELSEGCIVDINNLSKVRLTHPIVTNEDGRICTPYHVYTDFKVIGHEVLLNDVLEWLGVISEKGFPYAVLTDCSLTKWDSPDFVDAGKWDLTKPHLKDQSQELIEYLAGLATMC